MTDIFADLKTSRNILEMSTTQHNCLPGIAAVKIKELNVGKTISYRKSSLSSTKIGHFQTLCCYFFAIPV
jgi:hypothetical protein